MHEIYIDVFDTKEQCYLAKNVTKKAVSDIINVPVCELSDSIYKERRCRNRYIIVKAGEKIELEIAYIPIEKNDNPSIPPSLQKEWDDTCKLAHMLKSGEARMVTKYVKGKRIRYTEVI